MKTFLCICFLFSIHLCYSQSDSKEYAALVKRGDSLLQIKKYKESAAVYCLAFKTLGWKGYLEDRYHAARAWAMTGNADSAFFNLEKITTKLFFADYKRVTTDSDLLPLHKDKRWEPLLEQIKANKEKSGLVNLLDSMEKEDQKWRNLLSRDNNHEIDSIPRDTINKYMILTDSLNYYILKKIFVEHGYPNYDSVGETGSFNFWLLVQHQDRHPQFQDSVLTAMKKEVDNHKASASNYAYLVDRVKVNTGQLQVYGTQMNINSAQTSFEPKPVIEPEKLNERRASMGLPSIEDYIEMMNNRYYGSLRKR